MRPNGDHDQMGAAGCEISSPGYPHHHLHHLLWSSVLGENLCKEDDCGGGGGGAGRSIQIFLVGLSKHMLVRLLIGIGIKTMPLRSLACNLSQFLDFFYVYLVQSFHLSPPGTQVGFPGDQARLVGFSLQAWR